MENSTAIDTIGTNLNAEVMNNWAGLTKAKQFETAQRAIAAITGAYINPLTAYESIKAINETTKIIIDDAKVKDLVADEIARYGRGEDMPHGHKASVQTGGMKYDYSVCGDIILADLEADMEKLKAKIKNRQEYLKILEAPQLVVVPETGEEYTVHPPGKTHNPPVVKIEFKKA